MGACCFTSLGAAQVAEAAPTSGTVNLAPQQREVPSKPRWYGWQSLAVDGGALALGVTALFVKGDTQRSEDVASGLAIAGGVAYGAGAPTLHLLHDKPWHALGSFGMRGALPALGAVLWSATVTCPPPGQEYGKCGTGPLIFGAAAGALVAMALDATLLRWERPRVEAQSQASLGLAPVVSTNGGRELRLVGTF